MYKTQLTVGPHLEYCVSIWDPFIARNIDKLEQIQQRAIKLVPESVHVKQLRLQHHLNLYLFLVLAKRKKGSDRVSPDPFLSLLTASLYRGHDHKISIAGSSWPRLKFFTNRIVNQWNCPLVQTSLRTIQTIIGMKLDMDRLKGIWPNYY